MNEVMLISQCRKIFEAGCVIAPMMLMPGGLVVRRILLFRLPRLSIASPIDRPVILLLARVA